MKPPNYRHLLQVSSDAKTVKGERFGVLTGIMYLAPHHSSGVLNVCTDAGLCSGPCLNLAGRGIFKSTQHARIAKTQFLAFNRDAFVESARYDVAALERRADRLGMQAAVRFNGTSDLPWLPLLLCSEFPRVAWYDYTKHPRPWQRVRPNYHLTFSYDSIANLPESMDALAHGVNVAVVFDTRKGHPLPSTWHGYPVLDGDVSDLRFTDPPYHVVGLRAKGPAKHDTSGFVQIGGLS